MDAVLAYDFPFHYKIYLLLLYNHLHVPEPPLNLLSPFIMLETGMIVDKYPISQSPLPSIKHHSMLISDANIRIYFKLINTFSLFHIQTPTTTKLKTCRNVCIMPGSVYWNPYIQHFTTNRNPMIDCNGKLVVQADRKFLAIPSHESTHNVVYLSALLMLLLATS